MCVHMGRDPLLKKRRLHAGGEGLFATDPSSAPLRSNYLQQHQDQDLQTVHLPPCFIPCSCSDEKGGWALSNPQRWCCYWCFKRGKLSSISQAESFHVLLLLLAAETVNRAKTQIM